MGFQRNQEFEDRIFDFEPFFVFVFVDEVEQQVLFEGHIGDVDGTVDLGGVLDSVLVDVNQLYLELLPLFDPKVDFKGGLIIHVQQRCQRRLRVSNFRKLGTQFVNDVLQKEQHKRWCRPFKLFMLFRR